MHQSTRTLVVCATSVSLLFSTSCEQLGPIGSAVAGAAGGIAADALLNNGRIDTNRAIRSGIVGAAAGLALYYIAKANSQQQQIASTQGRSARSSSTVRRKISNGQAKKMAVVVPPRDGNPGGIMKVDPATGAPESNKIYQPKGSQSLNTGDVVRLDGTPCALYGSYSQGM